MNFDRSTQVSFLDQEGQECFGIAYGSEVICGCCGGVFDINESDLVHDIKALPWIDIADAINGT